MSLARQAGQGPSEPAPQQPPSLNIAIQDSKDFPADAPMQELHSDFIMADGRPLFECPELTKPTGFDLMNCPVIDFVLKLRVRRRTPQGCTVLWHVVLPLKQLSKYLFNPPHEWETWIGLFPHVQSLEAHPPETMFTQAVHLISRPEFPKLRLRFTYNNAELQAQTSAQREMEQQESRRRMELTQKVGKQQFEEIHKLTRGLRGTSGDSGPLEREAVQPPADVAAGAACGSLATPVVDHLLEPPSTPTHKVAALPAGSTSGSAEEALHSALAFINNVHKMLALHPRRSPGAPELPPVLTSEEVLRCKLPGRVLDANFMQLHECLCAAAYADAPDAAETERLLGEGLRMALMGLPSEDARLRARSPGLCEALREVSVVARERAALLEQLAALGAGGRGAPRRPTEGGEAPQRVPGTPWQPEEPRRLTSGPPAREVEVGQARARGEVQRPPAGA